METTVFADRFLGKIKAISSKSAAHRHIICNALADRSSTIICNKISSDIKATCDCIGSLGGVVSIEGDRINITPIKDKSKTYLNVKESGTTLRLLLPVIAALGICAEITAEGKLPQRPLSPLYDILSDNGCILSPEGIFPLTISGRLNANHFSIPGNISSQFISGLLLALPLLGGGTIEVTDGLESRSYVEMTIQIMKEHGIDITVENDVFTVLPGHYSAYDTTIEGDWSNASFWIAAGVLGGNVSIEGLESDSVQGDRQIVDIVRAFGGKITFSDGIITASRSSLKGIEIDAKDIPDMVPILSVIASNASGQSIIKHVDRLRLKESDRIISILDMINNLGGSAYYYNNSIIINGKTGDRPFIGGKVNSFNDHRIVMSAAIASILSNNPISIIDSQAKNKSYPSFFDDFTSIGGTIK